MLTSSDKNSFMFFLHLDSRLYSSLQYSIFPSKSYYSDNSVYRENQKILLSFNHPFLIYMVCPISLLIILQQHYHILYYLFQLTPIRLISRGYPYIFTIITLNNEFPKIINSCSNTLIVTIRIMNLYFLILVNKITLVHCYHIRYIT